MPGLKESIQEANFVGRVEYRKGEDKPIEKRNAYDPYPNTYEINPEGFLYEIDPEVFPQIHTGYINNRAFIIKIDGRYFTLGRRADQKLDLRLFDKQEYTPLGGEG